MDRPKVYAFEGLTPVVAEGAFVHPSAVLIGDVLVESGVFIGPCASLRGDFGRLIVMAGSNLQDGCVMHGYPGTDTVVEENGHVGHGAVLHGCRVGHNAMIGMNAVIMDDAEIGDSSIVAAASFVKAGWKVPPRVLVAGVPGRIVRALEDDEIARKTRGTRIYQELARRSLAGMQPVAALTMVEADRPRLVWVPHERK
ncbi:MAG: phenylacetic acid degradation protein PaaY [Sterolibacterium sp.]|nr:phenylacetic acid degradation protein PaaY [Sterolibacterium sp.]MBP9799942.1 phenylacetic acid degradation protein PaaY [Sterolibacterium sp.]